jgi:NAD(P)-dependent dehydrogenase (short-subunit alcohol dehydrogenase family)
MSTNGRLGGKVAVITGGGNGLGRATALRFSQEGAAIVIADLLEGPGRETVSMIEAAGGRAVFSLLDAANRLDNDAMAALAVETFGGLDILVTAAGISHGDYVSGDTENEIKRITRNMELAVTPGRSFIELPVENWQKVIDVNLTGTLFAMQACAARMVELQRPGAIVTIASIAAKHPDAGPVAYTVSKAGVWMLTKKAARELADAHIRVNSIGPGYIETNMTTVMSMLPEDRKAKTSGNIPMGRLGQPGEVANVALFLASDEASYVTGTIIHPDGGFYTD